MKEEWPKDVIVIDNRRGIEPDEEGLYWYWDLCPYSGVPSKGIVQKKYWSNINFCDSFSSGYIYQKVDMDTLTYPEKPVAKKVFEDGWYLCKLINSSSSEVFPRRKENNGIFNEYNLVGTISDYEIVSRLVVEDIE